ncbi:MAG: MarR family transcriptional regulator, partial [Phaeodactylibacter sp.]|nr:MarR family transcriptional regulator [Phaeodactylibacter sp.]
MKIEDEIKQRSFKSNYQKAQINIIFTAAWLNQEVSTLLRPYKLSWQQFNILRILRGMHPEPASVKLLTERMLDKMSNASLLVEKLKQKDMVDRTTCPEDRRRVEVCITDHGLEVLEKASAAIETEMTAHMSRISDQEAELLSNLLDQLR